MCNSKPFYCLTFIHLFAFLSICDDLCQTQRHKIKSAIIPIQKNLHYLTLLYNGNTSQRRTDTLVPNGQNAIRNLYTVADNYTHLCKHCLLYGGSDVTDEDDSSKECLNVFNCIWIRPIRNIKLFQLIRVFGDESNRIILYLYSIKPLP